jgi:hypothetical protein
LVRRKCTPQTSEPVDALSLDVEWSSVDDLDAVHLVAKDPPKLLERPDQTVIEAVAVHPFGHGIVKALKEDVDARIVYRHTREQLCLAKSIRCRLKEGRGLDHQFRGTLSNIDDIEGRRLFEPHRHPPLGRAPSLDSQADGLLHAIDERVEEVA